MGLFRFLLALLVIVAHTLTPGSLSVIHGEVAVRLFFVVSGFYMAMILSEKYAAGLPHRLWLFYSNRALRIFPLLWFALLVEVGLAFVLHGTRSLPDGHWMPLLGRLFHDGNFSLGAAYLAAQLSGFGVDGCFLISLSPDLTPSLYAGKIEGFVRGWQPLPLAHAWSISCELCFYLAAPFLTRLRTSNLCIVLVMATVLLAGLPRIFPPPFASVAGSFWFPMQSGFFVLGILAYRLYQSTRATKILLDGPTIRFGIVLALGLSMAFYSHIAKVSFTLSQLLLYGLALLAIPVLFRWSAGSKWDRMIGELSYPVYLVHITVKTALLAPWSSLVLGVDFHKTVGFMLATMVISCGLSWIMLRLIDLPINRWRQSRVLDAYGRRSG